MIKKAVFYRLRRNRFTSDFVALLSLRRRTSYLKEVGWFDSFNKSIPVNVNGVPIPWYTYAAIDFLDTRINEEMTVFEYGIGNSTIWWASRVSRVVSCEHDRQWFLNMKSSLPDNVECMHFDMVPSGDYSKAILQYDSEFDLIVIDGRDRVNCARNSLRALNGTGVIIWDNSDREDYRDGYDFLIDNGFKRLDFSGIGPVNVYGWCTSVFYKTKNCLGI